jgi:MFS family permease
LFYRLIRYDPNNVNDRNALYLVVEVFWAAILSAAAGFNGAYALRLGSTNTDIGLLTSLPALLAVILSIPAGQFLQARARRKPWILWALFFNRVGYLLVALVPFLKIAGLNQGTLVVLILIAISAPANLFNVGWIPMLAEIIPEDRRAAVFTARNITVNATVSVCGFLFGQWLNAIVFPINYQVLFVVGFLASMLSSYNLIKLQVPEAVSITPVDAASNSLKGQFNLFKRAMVEQPSFMRLTTNTFMYGVGLWLASPLYIVYYVRSLHASDAWIGLQGTVLSVTTILGWIFWRWMATRHSEYTILKSTIVTIGLIPLLVGLLPNLNLILLVVALNGLLSPGVNLCHLNTLMKVMPADQRPLFTALYTTLVNIGAFVCPLIGVEVSNLVGIAPTLIAFGALSILGASSFWWRPVKV